MSATKKSSGPTGIARNPSTGITDTRPVDVVEWVVVGAALQKAPEAISHLLDIGERVHKYFKDVDPIICQILDSTSHGDRYRVAVTISNQTLHGAYLETISLIKPDVKSLTYLKPRLAAYAEVGFSFESDADSKAPESSAGKPEVFTPVLISPGSTLVFGLEFALSIKGKKPSQAGQFVFRISRLDQKQPQDRDVSFLIRYPE